MGADRVSGETSGKFIEVNARTPNLKDLDGELLHHP